MASNTQEPRTEQGKVIPKHDDSHPIKVVEWHGKKNMQVHTRGKPMVTNSHDAIVEITSTAICGSDLHLYVNAMPGMQRGDVLGHEFMGIVRDVGPGVSNIQVGDRVVASFDIACGTCFYCKRQFFSCCDKTNPEDTIYTRAVDTMYGHRTSGIYGYSHLTGGYEGGQAEFARVPFADVNLLKVPDNLSDDKVLFLSDILPTAWHATELGEVSEGDTVAIWGCGPVGILAAHCAFARGAQHVIMIDCVPYRLEFAKAHVKGNLSTINFKEKKPKQALMEMVGPNGVDVGIEAVGFHYAKSWTHTIETSLMMETDPADILNEIITCVRKAGRISIVGVYAGYTNHFNIGGFMEKSMAMRGGQTHVQRYWKDLLSKVQEGILDPSFVITHKLPLDEAPEGYKIFNEKEDGCIKVVLKPQQRAGA
jgi:threonine dehydrogenase-like Zn-dependent dehydrogenase